MKHSTMYAELKEHRINRLADRIASHVATVATILAFASMFSFVAYSIIKTL